MRKMRALQRKESMIVKKEEREKKRLNNTDKNDCHF